MKSRARRLASAPAWYLARAGLVGLAMAFAVGETPAAADCNRSCAPSDRDVNGCCPAPAPKPPPGLTPTVAPPPAPRCPEGQEQTVDTGSHCCWPGQVWSGKCVGTPTSCPAGTHADVSGATCAPDQCPNGMKHPANAKQACCWPGQAYSTQRAACVGRPKCPKGFEAREEACVDLEAERLAAAQAAEAARLAKQREDEALARKQLEDERVRREAEEARLREERLKAEEAAKVAAAQRAAEAAAEADRQARERDRLAQEAEVHAGRRRAGVALMIVGGVAGVAAIGTGAYAGSLHGKIQGGGFATGADIANASSTGKTMFLASMGLTAGAVVFESIGIPIYVANRDGAPLVGLKVTPGGLVVRGAF